MSVRDVDDETARSPIVRFRELRLLVLFSRYSGCDGFERFQRQQEF